jgi:hypothetical protein
MQAMAEGEVGTLFIKNNGTIIGYIWVNGKYQGYVPPGRAHYTLSEGFVTRDSGIQPDGSVKQTYSHGGWDSKKTPMEVRIVQNDEKDGKRYEIKIDVSGDSEKKAYIWFGEAKPGIEPDGLVWERANQIPNAQAPVTPHNSELLKAAAETRKQEGLAGTSWKITNSDERAVFVLFEAKGNWNYRFYGEKGWESYGPEGTWKQDGNSVVFETKRHPEWQGFIVYSGQIKGKAMEGKFEQEYPWGKEMRTRNNVRWAAEKQ